MFNKSKNKHQEFIDSLKQTERTLIFLRDELYDGDWERMQMDLEDRLVGKPYIFKLVNRIKDDIARIDQLQAFEREHKIDLADFVELGE